MSNAQKMREEYFRAKGLGVPPVGQKDRLKKARELRSQVPPNFEAILMLFDPEEDKEDFNWINYMGHILDDHYDNPYFDAEKAFQFYVHGTKLGHSSSSFNIAAKYFNGAETEINFELALQYYKAAHVVGHYRAGAWIYEIAKRYDARLFDPQHQSFTSEILNFLIESSKRGSLEAHERVAGLCATGRGVKKNVGITINLYKHALNPNNELPDEDRARYGMIWKFALRTYLGLDVERDTNQALAILNAMPDSSNFPYVNDVLLKNKRKLKNIINREAHAPQRYRINKDGIEAFYFQGYNPAEIEFTKADTATIDVLWCMRELSHGEEWQNSNEWNKALVYAQANKMGFSGDDVLLSTGFAGPVYNPVSSNGLPVLGVWEQPSANEQETEPQILERGAYVPEAGVVKLKAVERGARQGTIAFDFIKASDSPALLVPEDFEIAMVLAYGHPNRSITPSLSLEDSSKHGFDDEYDVFKHKLWGPHWLRYTDFGRTLYITDQLIGAIFRRPKEFKIGSPNQAFHPAVSEFAIDLTEDIVLTGGRSGAGSYGRVMLKPEHVSLPHTKDRKGNISIKVAEVKMRVDGSYIVDMGEDGENRLVALNDDMYQQGRTVNKLTERYNDISSLMPVFARAQELMALMHSVAEARRLGFRLHPKIQDRITKRYKQFEAMPPLPTHEQLCVQLPLRFERF